MNHRLVHRVKLFGTVERDDGKFVLLILVIKDCFVGHVGVLQGQLSGMSHGAERLGKIRLKFSC